MKRKKSFFLKRMERVRNRQGEGMKGRGEIESRGGAGIFADSDK